MLPKASLEEIVALIENEMDGYDFVVGWDVFGLNGLDLDFLNSPHNKYYRAIQAYGKLFSGDHFCDLGTWWGLSACAAYGSFKKIDTFEVDPNQIRNIEALKKVCTLRIFDKPEDCLTLDYSPYDLVLVDVSQKDGYDDGDMEFLIHQHLERTYRGVVMYDDIDLTSGVQRFWRKIAKPKISLPRWHSETWHPSSVVPGFGIVDYR